MRPRTRRSRAAAGAAAVALLSLSGCIIHTFRNTEVVPVEAKAGSAAVVHSPVKAHLADGSTVLYPVGLRVAGDTVLGFGRRFDLALREAGGVTRLPLDSVIGMEAFVASDAATDALKSAAATIATSVVAIAGFIGMVCLADPKCFGSCPTVYSDSVGEALLEAELFSYSIAPLLEGRDVDPLRAGADAEGWVRLEVRNEALETHYINHLELLEVERAGDEMVVPDERGRPLALRRIVAPASARDRARRDALPRVLVADGRTYETSPTVLAAASAEDLRDHLDLVVPGGGRDSVAILFRLRNSLFNTILFYDEMMGSAGARALDWLAVDLQQIGPAVELGRWYSRHMGLRVLVGEDGDFREVARVPDSGPIAWKDVAVLVPTGARDSVRVRLSFVVDQWRIDRVAVALEARRPAARPVPLALVLGRDGRPDTVAHANLSEPDERYLRTGPGDYFEARFDAGPSGAQRTFLISSQGYYTEWVRPAWIRGAAQEIAFSPTDDALLRAIRRWQSVRPDLEARFHATRIPVR